MGVNVKKTNNTRHAIFVKKYQTAANHTFVIFPEGGLDLDEDGTDHFILEGPEPGNINYKLPPLIIVELAESSFPWRSYGIWRVVNG